MEVDGDRHGVRTKRYRKQQSKKHFIHVVAPKSMVNVKHPFMQLQSRTQDLCHNFIFHYFNRLFSLGSRDVKNTDNNVKGMTWRGSIWTLVIDAYFSDCLASSDMGGT